MVCLRFLHQKDNPFAVDHSDLFSFHTNPKLHMDSERSRKKFLLDKQKMLKRRRHKEIPQVLQALIVSFLPLRTIASLVETCKAWNAVWQEMLKKGADINITFTEQDWEVASALTSYINYDSKFLAGNFVLFGSPLTYRPHGPSRVKGTKGQWFVNGSEQLLAMHPLLEHCTFFSFQVTSCTTAWLASSHLRSLRITNLRLGRKDHVLILPATLHTLEIGSKELGRIKCTDDSELHTLILEKTCLFHAMPEETKKSLTQSRYLRGMVCYFCLTRTNLETAWQTSYPNLTELVVTFEEGKLKGNLLRFSLPQQNPLFQKLSLSGSALMEMRFRGKEKLKSLTLRNCWGVGAWHAVGTLELHLEEVDRLLFVTETKEEEEDLSELGLLKPKLVLHHRRLGPGHGIYIMLQERGESVQKYFGGVHFSRLAEIECLTKLYSPGFLTFVK